MFQPDGTWDGATRRVGLNVRLVHGVEAVDLPVTVIDGKHSWRGGCVNCRVTLDIVDLLDMRPIVEIESVRHKALRAFVETGRTKGLPGNLVGRLDDMLAYLAAIAHPAELAIPPNFGAHRLTGDLAGRWSLVVTKNWRMTFGVTEANAIVDLDLEDYH